MVWALEVPPWPHSLAGMNSSLTFASPVITRCLFMLQLDRLLLGNTSINKTQIQNRGARWICGSRFFPRTYRWSKSSEECCTELFWPSLSTRWKYLSLIMIYDILHNHVSLQFSDYFTFSSTSTRSHSLSLLCKQSSLNSYRYSFFMNSIFWWNSIPFDILSITRWTTFRRLLYNSLCVN